MRVIVFDPDAIKEQPQKEWWARWSRRAEDATAQVVAEWEEWVAQSNGTEFRPTFRSEVWADLKRWFKEHCFQGKCAYCEIALTGMYGDAEHFRPKGRVRDSALPSVYGRGVEYELPEGLRKEGPQIISHPGYFWLAYDWRNLVPSCHACNEGGGKCDQFPTSHPHLVLVRLSVDDAKSRRSQARPSVQWPGFWYLGPEDLDESEQPLLLNPLNASAHRHPDLHVAYGIRGLIVERSESKLGRRTIQVFRLDRDELRLARQRQQELIKERYLRAFCFFEDPQEALARAEEAIASFSMGSEPFSSAALAYLSELRCRLAPR